MDLDRYHLVRTIASGGMGQVYEAIARGHGGFERRVAIKRLLPELLGNQRARALFRDEARIASHLHHGNIVQVLDFGLVDGDEFLVLEYVEGIDAERLRVQLGALPEPVALYIVAEIAHALAYAHDRRGADGVPLGIIHRDVSAHNILLSWEGDVKLSDFGIAFAASRDARTQTGVVKGKFGYLSPEQARGEPATTAVDVYALGVTLCISITDDFPDAPPIRGAPRPSPPVLALIQRCLSADPADRPSAAELAAEASRLAHGTSRQELRDLLTRARSASGSPRSALDDLMGMALVPAGDGTFSVHRRANTLANAKTDPAVLSVKRGRAPRRVAALAVAAVGLAAATVVAVTADSQQTSQAPSHGDGRAAVDDARPPDMIATTAAAAAQSVPTADAATDIVSEADVGSAVDKPSPPTGAAGKRRRERPSRREATSTSPPRPSGETATVPSASGWIRIGGRTLANNEVHIDGRGVGFAPLSLELASGRHRIVVRTGDGAVALDKVIEINARHTRQTPVKLIR